ncbi:MAG: peptidylprolyl isomerase [Verrucomicrobiota bacterium]
MSAKVFSFHYTLTNAAGQVLDSSEGREPLVFMAGAGQIIPGLEAELVQLTVGDKKKVAVPAVDAYGEHDPKKMIEVPLEKLPKENIEVGDQFQAGGQHSPFTVTSLTETHATLDGNHPLAGVDLTFDVEVTGVREASLEELAHGHAHGPGGHGH